MESLLVDLLGLPVHLIVETPIFRPTNSQLARSTDMYADSAPVPMQNDSFMYIRSFFCLFSSFVFCFVFLFAFGALREMGYERKAQQPHN